MPAQTDYRTIVAKGERRDFQAGTGLDRRWWTLPPDDAAQSITSTVSALKEAQRDRMRRLESGSLLYGNTAGLNSSRGYVGTTTTLSAAATAAKGRVTKNVMAMASDTIVSKMTKSKPRPFYLSSGGMFREHRTAKKLNKVVDGMFYENRAYVLGALAFRDACPWGDGLAKVVPKNDRVVFERVLPDEIWVDEVEAAATGTVRSMYHERPVDRRKLAEEFPDYAEKILAANATETRAGATAPDMVTVRESWHLRSGPKADDGKHLFTIEAYAISEIETWRHDFFPFARVQWSAPLYGFWSESLAEKIAPIQYERNRLAQAVQRATYKAGLSVTWVPLGSNVPKEFINNAVDSVQTYAGTTPPRRETYPIVPPEVYEQIAQYDRDAFAAAHISELSATAQKPAGLDSGRALREFTDTESDGFRTLGASYENFYLDLARIGLAVASDIAKAKGGKYRVYARSRGSLEEVTITSVELDAAQSNPECFPVSSLPRDPAGRLQTIQEYAQAGYLTPREARRLLDFPDLESVESLATAAEERIDQCLGSIVDEGVNLGPTPEDDLDLAQEMGLQYLQLGRTRDLDPDRLALLETYLRNIGGLRKMAADIAAAEAAKMAPPRLTALPGGLSTPQTTPVAPTPSPLLPNTPMQAAA